MTYIKPALEQLYADDAVMTAGGLAAVLKRGMERRNTYYRHRVDNFDNEQLQYLTDALPAIVSDAGVSRGAVVETLSQYYTSKEAEKLFAHFLLRGVLARVSNGYAVPIPAMHEWLLAKYPPYSTRAN